MVVIASLAVQGYWKRAEQLEREKAYPGAIADFQEVSGEIA